MRSRILTRIAAVAIILGSTAVGTAMTAPSAFAIPPDCTGSAILYSNYGALTSPPEAYAQEYYYWAGCTYTLPLPVSISKYVSGTWEEVASGEGVVTYDCTGGTALYATNIKGSSDFDCG